MRFERFIAQRFLPRDRKSYSGPLVSIATYSIALGVIVMILSVSILRGFQKEIRQKVVGFGSHIVVGSYAMGNTYEPTPIDITRPEVELIREAPGVKHLQFFAEKGGMVKTEDQIQGVIFKGVDADFDSAFFASHLVEGRLFAFPEDKPSNEIIVSQTIADKLHLNLGDKVRTYFWQTDTYRARAFEVCGIYNTDLNDFDEHYLVGDLRQVQRLNEWDSTQVAGYEVLVDNFAHLDRIANSLLPLMGYDLTLTTIVTRYPALFSWLDLLDSNIILIIVIMMLVCIVSVISALLIMIFEKTSTIGILKALGTDNSSIRRIFLIKCASIVGRGIVWGNVIALILCWLQHHFQIISLDSASYSMSSVPIDLNPWIFLAVSLGTLVVCVAAMLIPAAYISHVQPAKSIKMS